VNAKSTASFEFLHFLLDLPGVAVAFRAFSDMCVFVQSAEAAWRTMVFSTRRHIMNYEERDPYGMYKESSHGGPGPQLMGANTLIGDTVQNRQGEKLGDIKEIMLNVQTGKIAYAVLSFGGVFTIGEKLFAVPWNALQLDTVNKCLVLNASKDRLQDAPGFNSDRWPDMADQTWSNRIHSYYDVSPL
jgi:sporulation protein YlmC with PRC-barrel domain